MECKVEQIHCGQYKPYGDWFEKWKIITENKNKDDILKYCFENLYKHEVPPHHEWSTNIAYGHEKFDDANYYFRGYYELDKIEDGYIFTICEPFAD